jgi:hypothetical protein
MLAIVVRIAGARASPRTGFLALETHSMKLAARNSIESLVFASQHMHLISTSSAFCQLAYLTQVLHPRGFLSHFRFRRLHGLHARSMPSAYTLSSSAGNDVAMPSKRAGKAEMNVHLD